MILFTILCVIALMLLITSVFLLSVGGTAFIIVFGDLIICVVFVVLILKAMLKKKR